MEQNLDKPTLDLERQKHRNKMLYLGGLGCLLLLILMTALILIFFNLIVKLF